MGSMWVPGVLGVVGKGEKVVGNLVSINFIADFERAADK